MISFGPIPSRRLGKSLGINNIPAHKICTYSCVYCQVGPTKEYSTIRREFYAPDVIFKEVQKHLQQIDKADHPDYLTFVANGEPTLDINIGKSIEALKALHIPIAVITNASLLKLKEVRDDLKLADWVSIKIDTNNESIWNLINNPDNELTFKSHIQGILQFASEYKGILVTETMLAEGINDHEDVLQQTSELIKKINPSVAYISVPTRPPAMAGIKPPKETTVNEAFQIFSNQELKVELLLGFEGTNTGYTGNAIEDIINICTVHPIREDTMKELLHKDKADSSILDSLLHNKLIKKISYKSDNFYIRQFHV